MRKRYEDRWFRNPRTTAEKRANQEREYVRGRRSPHMLPNSWDDYPIHRQKSWKRYRLKQYRVDGRGEKHTMTLDWSRYGSVWYLEEALKEQNVSFDVRAIYDIEYRIVTTIRDSVINWDKGEWKTRRVKVPRNIHGPNKQKVGWITETYWEHHYKSVQVEIEPREYRYHHHRGWKLTWWSNKDIGINHIIASIHQRRSYW